MKSILIFFIHIYQILPLSSHQMCRFTPTCSNYAKEAISTYGFWKGCKLSMKRIMKCRPKGSFGYDPVPGKEEKS